MIIVCTNCYKKFNIDPKIIPEKGRLLQCSSCNHKWFFEKKTTPEPSVSIEIDNNIDEVNSAKIEKTNDNMDNIEFEKNKSMEVLDKANNSDFVVEKTLLEDNKKINEESNLIVERPKNKKKYNILGLSIVFIISFIAIIIVVDTFQTPIKKIVPDIEFILYNLYQTIYDVELFLRDLI